MSDIATHVSRIGSSPEPQFEERSLTVLTRLRSAIANAFATVPGGIQKSNDIQKKFGQSFNVSWQIYRILRADHLLEISSHIPTPKPMQKLLSAMAQNGISEDAILEVRRAYEAFDEFVRATSGDRTTFEAMTTRAIGGVTDSEVEHTRRREIFDSYRYVLGFEQDLFVSLTMLHPNDSAGYFDSAYIRIRKNLRRLRSDVAMRIDATWVGRLEANPPRRQRFALDEEAFEKHGIYILPEFCSQRDIPLERVELPSGYMITKWKAEGVGQSGTIDLAIGSLSQRIEWTPNPRGIPSHQLHTSVLTPTRKFINDFLVHRSAFGNVDFDITQWYMTDVVDLTSRFEDLGVPQIPCGDRMVSVRGIEGGAIPELPNYIPMIRKYCNELGWRPEDMVLYRMRTEYPILHVLQRIEMLAPSLPR